VLPVSVRLPNRAPPLVGVKLTFIAQLLPAGTTVPVLQVVPLAAMVKSPVTTTLESNKDPWPVLLTVTGCALEVEPTGCPWNAKLPVDRFSPGDAPVTWKGTLLDSVV
jgi:hypothetical protein